MPRPVHKKTICPFVRFSNGQTIWHPTSFRPFEYQTSSVFRSPLYYIMFCFSFSSARQNNDFILTLTTRWIDQTSTKSNFRRQNFEPDTFAWNAKIGFAPFSIFGCTHDTAMTNPQPDIIGSRWKIQPCIETWGFPVVKLGSTRLPVMVYKSV